jgi:hypothetical protein
MNDPGQAVVAASAMSALLSREHAILEFNRISSSRPS